MECFINILSVLVGILALLTTVLIGWQIYLSFDIRRLRDEIKREKDAVVFESHRNILVTTLSLSDYYYSLLVNCPIKDVEFNYFQNRLYALSHASTIGDFETCNVIIKRLLETVTEELRVSRYNRGLLLSTLQEVKKSSKIQNYQELLRLVLNMNVLD